MRTRRRCMAVSAVGAKGTEAVNRAGPAIIARAIAVEQGTAITCRRGAVSAVGAQGTDAVIRAGPAIIAHAIPAVGALLKAEPGLGPCCDTKQ